MQAIWALGAMSGTSLDGVDAAMLRTDGVEIFEFGASAYRPYSEAERGVLRAALGSWPDDPGVAPAAEVVEAAHVALLGGFEGFDIVGFHGQTLAHDPRGRGTHQAGAGPILAAQLGRPVVWDFRSADVALGGEGAPLVPVFHAACARWCGISGPVAFLNLGGVGNLTWVDGAEILAFDTGPANAPMDDLVLASGRGTQDEAGAWAAVGRVDESAVMAAMAHPFYGRIPPKSLDRSALFASLRAIRALPLEDALASLCAVIAQSVERALEHCPRRPERLLVCGGGRHNVALMAALRARVGLGEPVEVVGLDGDMLEAQAFGYLAVRVMRGLPTSFPSTTGVAADVAGGQIARP